MAKQIFAALCGCLLFFGANGQSLSKLLESIEENNQTLKVAQAQITRQSLENRQRNNLPNPEASAYFLPFGAGKNSAYTEYQVSQSFEFPTVYRARSQWNRKEEKRLQLEYRQKRQAVLLQAQSMYWKYVYLEKQKRQERTRLAQAQKVFEHMQTLYEKKQAGILDMNKAKIAWMNDRFAFDALENEQQKVRLSLKQLNGGKPVDLAFEIIEEDFDLPDLEVLWEEKKLKDPALYELKEQEELAAVNLKLARRLSLPNISLGYNSQGVKGDVYSGFYGGLSIPLWKNKNKVKAARELQRFAALNAQTLLSEAHAKLQRRYREYSLLFGRFQGFQNAFGALQSDALLYKAYSLGEMSFMEYYTELQFFRKAALQMLAVEKELRLRRADLLQHRL